MFFVVCEHKFGLRKRQDGTFYCPVCRAEIYEREIINGKK